MHKKAIARRTWLEKYSSGFLSMLPPSTSTTAVFFFCISGANDCNRRGRKTDMRISARPRRQKAPHKQQGTLVNKVLVFAYPEQPKEAGRRIRLHEFRDGHAVCLLLSVLRSRDVDLFLNYEMRGLTDR